MKKPRGSSLKFKTADQPVMFDEMGVRTLHGSDFWEGITVIVSFKIK